ncbi:MAG TPA: PEP-CTERM sorting domain-containing protein, partial [Candidatus Binatia bacterium]|nr:PEP-CTERM sorting domain-containing protein [Candidatus Binatia bacterium]
MSNPYLAGMPDGSTASSGDTAPAQSPAEVLGFPVTPRSVVRFTASGSVRWNPNQPYYGPEGELDLNTAHLAGAQNGISDVTMPANALLGVL